MGLKKKTYNEKSPIKCPFYRNKSYKRITTTTGQLVNSDAHLIFISSGPSEQTLLTLQIKN